MLNNYTINIALWQAIKTVRKIKKCRRGAPAGNIVLLDTAGNVVTAEPAGGSVTLHPMLSYLTQPKTL